MTVKVKTFELTDLDNFDCRDPNWSKVDPEHLLTMPMATLLIEDIPIALFGLLYKHKGVAEAFMYGSPLIKTNKIAFQEKTKELLDFCIPEYEIHRLEMYVDLYGTKWAESLGFEFEGKVSKYTEEKQDAYLYARFE